MDTVSLKGCKTALVYGTNNKPLSKARVLDTGSSIYLFFENRNLKQARVKVPVDFQGLWNGVIRCFCELHIRRNQQIGNSQEVWAAECKVLQLINTIQRQKDFRVKTNMPIFFNTHDSILKKGTIKNISAGGIFLVTTKVLENGTKIWYDLTLNGETCEIKARIVYGRVLPEGYGYGCSYRNLPEKTVKVIRDWCYEKERSAKEAGR